MTIDEPVNCQITATMMIHSAVVGFPRKSTCGLAQCRKHRVDAAASRRTEDVLEQVADDEGGDHHRGEDDGAQRVPPEHLTVQQQREPQSDRVLDDHDRQRDEECADRRRARLPLEDLDVVVEPDEARGRGAGTQSVKENINALPGRDQNHVDVDQRQRE